MPNWCYQTITIAGAEPDLDKFKADVRATKKCGDFNHLYPIPEELANTTSGFFSDSEKQAAQEALENENLTKHGYKDWYDWACDKWGTKWGACDVDMEVEPLSKRDIWFGTFTSAWAPADGLMVEISRLYPTLIIGISFTEESDAYAGWKVWRAGKVIAEREWEPSIPEADWDSPDFDEDVYWDMLNEERNKVSRECQLTMTDLVKGFAQTRKVYAETGG